MLPDLFQIVRACDDNLKDFITWKFGTLVSIVRQVILQSASSLMILFSLAFSRIGLFGMYALTENVIFLQHIRKYLSDLLALISELWCSFTLPAANRSVRGLPVCLSYIRFAFYATSCSYISLFWWNLYLFVYAMLLRCAQVLHLVEQLCVALNDEFRTYLPAILPCCIQVLSDAEKCNDYTYVPDILHTLEVFGGVKSPFFAVLHASGYGFFFSSFG